MALAIVLSGAAEAQEMPWPAPNCAAMDLGLPVSLAGWQAKNSLTSATQAAALDTTTLPLGQGMIVTLHPTGSVVYVTQPEKPGGSVAHGGMVAVFISKPGRYQVSLGSGAWIDMVRDGAFVTSAAHAPGPKCSSIRKTVIFPLQPGRYVLQISANADPTLPVMVTPMP
ncbi:MAG TPA: hypothetical protein VHA37_08060 [Candidatus Saccharimonadales bacterium]|nr:hypothetical protein [Candidatus Saccharimonadales bacterium]